MPDDLGDEVPLINEGGDIFGEGEPDGDPQDDLPADPPEVPLPPDPFPPPPQPTDPFEEDGGPRPVDPLPGDLHRPIGKPPADQP